MAANYDHEDPVQFTPADLQLILWDIAKDVTGLDFSEEAAIDDDESATLTMEEFLATMASTPPTPTTTSTTTTTPTTTSAADYVTRGLRMDPVGIFTVILQQASRALRDPLAFYGPSYEAGTTLEDAIFHNLYVAEDLEQLDGGEFDVMYESMVSVAYVSTAEVTAVLARHPEYSLDLVLHMQAIARQAVQTLRSRHGRPVPRDRAIRARRLQQLFPADLDNDDSDFENEFRSWPGEGEGLRRP